MVCILCLSVLIVSLFAFTVMLWKSVVILLIFVSFLKPGMRCIPPIFLCMTIIRLKVMAIDKSLRLFERFRANIELSVHIPTQSPLKIYSSTEFICAFSLRGLIACVRPRTYMPSRFCDCSVSFEVIPEDLPETFNPYRHPLCMHNYEQITAMIVRNIVFVLATETRLSYFNNGLI